MEFSAGLMPLETALTQMLSRITPLTAVETLPLVNCFGRILATDIVSPLDVPGFDNSAMDGYAVRVADLSADKPLPVAGKAFAGQPYQGEWPAGTCIRIMTGAPVPAGCEAVVMQEQTEQPMTACVLPPMFVADKTSAAAARIFARMRWSFRPVRA